MSNNQHNSAVDFRRQQADFTAYIRNPDGQPVPKGVQPERMALYAELLFNNIEGFLAGNFPVLKKIHSSEQWLALVRDFFAQHQSVTPYFVEIAQEFISYLQNERDSRTDYPFLLELAHYEWVELALSLLDDEVKVLDEHLINHLAELKLALSPLAWSLAYHYPVQCIAPDYLPTTPPEEPTCLVVYRDSQDDVHFLQITPMTYQLLDYLQTNPAPTCLQCLTEFAHTLNVEEPSLIIQTGLETLQYLASKGILIQDNAA